jgi:acyl carrier protein
MTALDESRQEILETVGGMIREVIGEAWVSDTAIGMETTFSNDLEVESIEIVALAEKLQARYGEQVDFPAWLSSMELEQIINLTVGQLVEFIASCQ